MSAQYTSGLVPKIHRIALVDNDPRALESLSYLIEAKVPTAYVVWTATSGNEAIERCQETGNNLSLLILDMSMEGLQGPATCRRIRLVDRHLPILGVTSFSIRSYREEQIISLCADGLLDREIAEQLDISESTVRKHMQSILKKLNCKTARQAVALWVRSHAV